MRTMTFGLSGAGLLALAIAALSQPSLARAQSTQNEPATDSSSQASPIQPAPRAPITDSSSQASPIGSGDVHSASIAPHTVIDLKLGRSIDSGRLKNGETIPATLLKPVALSPKGELEPGSPVQLTVVETLRAGLISAEGEFSLQVQSVGPVPVSTNTLTYRGKPGHKTLPDSAPAVGTDAGLAAGAELVFHVLPPPAPANGPPKARNGGPGSVDGVASGAAPPAGSGKQSGANATKTNKTPADGANPAETAQPHP